VATVQSFKMRLWILLGSKRCHDASDKKQIAKQDI
jgi:hypothetical protein